MKYCLRYLLIILLCGNSGIQTVYADIHSKDKESGQALEKAQKSKQKKKTRVFKLNTNFLFNEIVKGGAFKFNTSQDRFLNEKDAGWCDYFTLSYDYTTLSHDYGDLLKKQRKNKEKKLWILGYHLSYKKKPFVDVTYSSDGTIGLYSTFLVGGLGKEFSNGIAVEGGLGVKTGNVNFQKEKYNVVNFIVGYKTPNKKGDYKFNALVKAYLPRKYLTNNSGKSLWMVDAKASLGINKKIFGIMPAVGVSFRRDYIPVIVNKVMHYEGIVRYNITLGFNVAKGGIVKKE